jgi:mRNA-degrading endonuclease RelE of RelBE toxin-antitoxin system
MKERVDSALPGLLDVPPRGDIKGLKGRRGGLRLRVGDWRVLFTYEGAQRDVVVSRILPRGRAYRD